MIRKITLLFLACVMFLIRAQAQYCGFDQKHQQLLANDPAYAQKVQQMNSEIASMIGSNSNSLIVNTPNGLVYQIPVVIHVIHTGGAVGSNYNPADATLIGMINYLNQAYAATWPSYPGATSGGTYIPLQFVLAQRTPQCAATNGIVRVDGSSVPNYVAGGVDNGSGIGANEIAVKNLSRWPNTEYYNVWVVNKIDGQDGITSTGPFTAGYAYFAGAPATVDGTIMLASQAHAGEITLPHEIGHAFGVYHTFEGDNGGTTCPTNVNCATDGDEVCDTDPHMRSVFNCPTGTNSCTGAPYGTVVHNFMDYSSCQDRFTPGQKTRMLAALLNSRGSLISSLGGTPLPATPMIAACVPAINNPGNTDNAGPRNIVISDATTTYMSVTSSGYNGDGSLVYVDKTCKHQVELTAGNIYNFSVKTGQSTIENVKIFVDYNNDGTFQANEEIYANTGTTFNQTHTFQYTVPTTATIPGLISCTPLRMRVISDRAIAGAISACGPLGYGQAEDYIVIIRGGGPTTGSVAVSLTSGTNPSCFNSPLTFTASPGAGLTANGYRWFVNGTDQGVTTSTFTTSSVTNNDIVTVQMYYTGPCGNDSTISNGFLVLRQATVPAAVSIAVTTGTNPGCPGQTLTFTANPANGGSAPSYQWKVNGGNVGTNSPTYSAVFNNNDVVTVDMISNSSCASPTTATSSPVTVQHLLQVQDITIALSAGQNPGCAGKPLTFMSNVLNGGSATQYQWFENGVAIPGATNSTFTSTTLSNNSLVTAVSTVNGPCILNPSDTSDPIGIVILPSDTPNIAIAITKGDNPGCLDSLVEFTATVTHHGATPDLTWFVNGIQVGTGNVYSTNGLLNGDVVTFRSAATDVNCYTTDTLISAPIVAVRSSTPLAPVISFIGNMLVSNMPNVIWFDTTNGGTQIPGATGASYHPTHAGAYYAMSDNNGCHSAPSNMLAVSLLDIATYDMSQVKIYPNPTDGRLILDWGNKTVNMMIEVYSVTGQGLMHDELKNGSRKQLNLAHFANGNYFIVLRDDAGNIGTMKIAINK